MNPVLSDTRKQNLNFLYKHSVDNALQTQVFLIEFLINNKLKEIVCPRKQWSMCRLQ